MRFATNYYAITSGGANRLPDLVPLYTQQSVGNGFAKRTLTVHLFVCVRVWFFFFGGGGGGGGGQLSSQVRQ